MIRYCGTEICPVTEFKAGDQQLRTGLIDGDKTLVFYSEHQGSNYGLSWKVFQGNRSMEKRISLPEEFYPMGSLKKDKRIYLAGFIRVENVPKAAIFEISDMGVLSRKYIAADSNASVFNAIIHDESGLYLAGWSEELGMRQACFTSFDFQLKERTKWQASTEDPSAYVDLCFGAAGGLYLLGHENKVFDRDLLLSYSNFDSLIWSKNYGSPAYEEAQNMVLSAEGNLVIAAHSAKEDPLHQAYCLLLDSEGNLLWERHFGGAKHDGCEAVIESLSGDLVFVIRSESYSEDSDILVLRLNKSGGLISEELIIEEGINEAYEILEAEDHLLLLGRHIEAGGQNENIHLVRMPK